MLDGHPERADARDVLGASVHRDGVAREAFVGVAENRKGEPCEGLDAIFGAS